ncbi:Repressor of RNA polymerase III transcription maf1 [Escovopsis weberi]|uniref:Repressor of RNA polymerase III transcription MAF1 n=1 Tax=Escovopsis weberi TaxID=150374 RepID=A0A0M9VW54_ESCWE|nr:Repressor of RNA polymerase III transcription maf1 [Escovopsis weberi]
MKASTHLPPLSPLLSLPQPDPPPPLLTPPRRLQYLPVQDFEAVTSALNFNTPDCNITGGCDLYITKSTGSDKKLYKNIEKDLGSQQAALIKLGASLSPLDRQHMMATSQSAQLFSHSSAFGPLSQLSSRRTFAYLIATLNASHPHYDFSHVLRPGDFKRERSLKRVMANLDSILQNVRPGFEGSSYSSSLGADMSSQWGPHCWSLINKEMRLNECTIFSYHPEIDPFEEDESAIWAVHYFFFNRPLKRVAYLYVRVVPVISSQSPSLHATRSAAGKRPTDPGSDGAKKRAKYWLGDQEAELVPSLEDDESHLDDGWYWNRGEDGDIVQLSDDDIIDEEDEDEDDDYDELDELDDEDMVIGGKRERCMSEEFAGRMEI